jgi:lipopolysaccharide biosynthesis protein
MTQFRKPTLSGGRHIPKWTRKLKKHAYRVFGYDDFWYLALTPDTPARKSAEAPLPVLEPSPHPVDRHSSVRISLHLHYPELWDEFEALLKASMPKPKNSTCGRWGLFVTLTPNAANILPEISRAFPGAVVEVLENRGRDIGPFFELLSRGAFDGAEAVCKLHGKRSLSERRPQLLGEVWRRSAVRSLLGEPEAVIKALSGPDPLFLAAGPGHLFAPSKRISETSAWGGLRSEIEEWSARMSLPDPEIRFFAGSMLWLGGTCLTKLRHLGLCLDSFEPESALSLYGPTYTGERIFLMPVQLLKGRIGLLSPDGKISERL